MMRSFSGQAVRVIHCNDLPITVARMPPMWLTPVALPTIVNDLNKLLAGKNVSLAPYISAYFEGMNGSSTRRDLRQ